jgi:DNA topoisomerase I
MTPAPRVPRLRRSDCSGAGLRRARRGKGFSFLDETGRRITNPEVIDRLRELAIPPAWQDVWICPDPFGHLQATGVDAAGRKQYLYHPRWREHRDRQKFEKMLRFAQSLPKLRKRVAADLTASEELTEKRVLACAVRLLDVGMFRVGSEQYAEDEHGVGLATLRKEHVSQEGEALVFDYPAKGGIRRVQAIVDPQSREIIRALKRRRGGVELLAYRSGRRWCDVRSDEINDYLKRQMGEDFSAKDFRTWNATVMAAVVLGTDGRAAATKTARKRATDRAVRAVAELLGNTPAVARRAYIDPRVLDRYLSGWTIGPALDRIPDLDPADDRVRARIERAVLDLLAENENSVALEQLDQAA